MGWKATDCTPAMWCFKCCCLVGGITDILYIITVISLDEVAKSGWFGWKVMW